MEEKTWLYTQKPKNTLTIEQKLSSRVDFFT